MPIIKFPLLIFAFVFSGCTPMQQATRMYTGDLQAPSSFQYKEGGTSVYYTFNAGAAPSTETVVFFYGGTGCASWTLLMPEYFSGLTINSRVYALNKRFVSDRSLGQYDCGEEFKLVNNPRQWVLDYTEFIKSRLNALSKKPKNVVLVGVNEGALTAARVAALIPRVTHLAIIGSGGYTLRQALTTFKQKGDIRLDIDGGLADIAANPGSIYDIWNSNTYRWWSDLLDKDPLPDLLKLDIPILVGIGEKDKVIPVESARFLDDQFKEQGKNNLTLKVYPGADHKLSNDGASSRKAFFTELSAWIQQSAKVR
jgi:pimeloyl-ACP methyl ester carboxylesterase